MQGNHIVKRLEHRAVSAFSKDEITVIEAHVADCSDCLQAYEAARVSEDLIRARAAETITPSPFFKTRIMAAIKERQLSPELPAIVRMWRAAGALVSMLTIFVAILVGISFYGYSPDPRPEPASSESMYSLEYVEFEQADIADNGVAYDQVLGTIYDSEDADGQ